MFIKKIILCLFMIKYQLDAKAEMIVQVVDHAKEKEIMLLEIKLWLIVTDDGWDVWGDGIGCWLLVTEYCDCDCGWLDTCVDGCE